MPEPTIPQPERGPMRKSEDVLADIDAKLATIDGIAISDAVALGRLMQEYGMAMRLEGGGEIMKPIMKMLLDGIQKPGREGWQGPVAP